MFLTNCATPRTRIPTMALGLALVFFTPIVVQAATFNIADGDVAGLIAAISAANSSGVPNVINLATGGTYTLTAVAEDDGYAGGAGLPYIRNSLTINGQGATIQRSSAAGTPNFRIIFVFVSSLTLDGVTISGGNGGNDNRGGGGLGMTASTALITNSTITGNYGIFGGGIYHTSSVLTLENSTVSYNTGYSAYGGGGVMNVEGTTTVNFSTIFENRSDGPPGFQGRGDAISDAFSPPGSITVKNSILASPTLGLGDACAFFTANSLGHNVAGDASCGLTGVGDMNSTNPLLGPTANNGGPTATDLPLVGSPAIDAVPIAYCTDANGVPVTSDQRGIARPQGPACDIGSVEVTEALYHVCLGYDPTKAVRSGSTLPIKLQLCDGSGNDLSSSSITVLAVNVTQVSSSITGPVEDSGDSNPDSNFRFDPTAGSTGGYIFNLKTTGLATGTYNINFTVTGDPFVYATPFQVK